MGKTSGVIYGDQNATSFGPARNGGVWVMAEQCDTCIFRPGNLMHLSPGRAAQMKRDADKLGTCIICHETMSGPNAAVCRGYYDGHRSSLLQMAERMELIREHPKP